MKYKMTARILGVYLVLQCLQQLFPAVALFQVCQVPSTGMLWSYPLFLVTLFSHMFSHEGWGHMLGNCVVGIPAMLFLEHKIGSKGLLKTHLLCGLIAVAVEMFMPIGGGGMIGASGAIMGCFAAACTQFGKGSVGSLMGAGLLALLVVPNLQALSVSLLLGNVGYAAHIGGVLAGLFLMACRGKK